MPEGLVPGFGLALGLELGLELDGDPREDKLGFVDVTWSPIGVGAGVGICSPAECISAFRSSSLCY